MHKNRGTELKMCRQFSFWQFTILNASFCSVELFQVWKGTTVSCLMPSCCFSKAVINSIAIIYKYPPDLTSFPLGCVKYWLWSVPVKWPCWLTTVGRKTMEELPLQMKIWHWWGSEGGWGMGCGATFTAGEEGAGTEVERGIYYTLFSACRSDCILSLWLVFLGTMTTPITILLFYLIIGQVLLLSHYDSMILVANSYTTI